MSESKGPTIKATPTVEAMLEGYSERLLPVPTLLADVAGGIGVDLEDIDRVEMDLKEQEELVRRLFEPTRQKGHTWYPHAARPLIALQLARAVALGLKTNRQGAEALDVTTFELGGWLSPRMKRLMVRAVVHDMYLRDDVTGNERNIIKSWAPMPWYKRLWNKLRRSDDVLVPALGAE